MTTQSVPSAVPGRPSRAGELLRRIARGSGPLAVHFAGRRAVTIWALIRYRGRRSGREYSIPIAIGVTDDSFFVPMPFAGAQWVQNVLVAAECVIRWNGREHRASEPRVVGRADATPAFGPIARRLVPIVGIERFLRLRRE